MSGSANGSAASNGTVNGHERNTHDRPSLHFTDAGLISALEAYYPKLRDSFLSHVRAAFSLPDSAIQRLHRMFDYNILGGKYYRATLVLQTIQAICRQKQLDIDEYWESGLVAGWAVEVLQAMFLVADDMMDKSRTRRGKPCWYLVPDVQYDAINDSLILESFLFHHLTQHFAAHPQYTAIVQLYQQVSLATQMGQMLDLTSQPLGRRETAILRSFNLPMYTRIVTHKTALYTFDLPLAAGLLLTNFSDPTALQHVKMIAVELGVKFQIQDDYLDCFGLPEVIGKIGTDIKDHKCSWLVVKAMEVMAATGDKEGMAVLEENYGWDDDEKERKIKELYERLALTAVFEAQEKESYARIRAMIEQHKKELPEDMFLPILNKIHLRQK